MDEIVIRRKVRSNHEPDICVQTELIQGSYVLDIHSTRRMLNLFSCDFDNSVERHGLQVAVFGGNNIHILYDIAERDTVNITFVTGYFAKRFFVSYVAWIDWTVWFDFVSEASLFVKDYIPYSQLSKIAKLLFFYKRRYSPRLTHDTIPSWRFVSLPAILFPILYLIISLKNSVSGAWAGIYFEEANLFVLLPPPSLPFRSPYPHPPPPLS